MGLPVALTRDWTGLLRQYLDLQHDRGLLQVAPTTLRGDHDLHAGRGQDPTLHGAGPPTTHGLTQAPIVLTVPSLREGGDGAVTRPAPRGLVTLNGDQFALAKSFVTWACVCPLLHRVNTRVLGHLGLDGLAGLLDRGCSSLFSLGSFRALSGRPSTINVKHASHRGRQNTPSSPVAMTVAGPHVSRLSNAVNDSRFKTQDSRFS